MVFGWFLEGNFAGISVVEVAGFAEVGFFEVVGIVGVAVEDLLCAGEVNPGGVWGCSVE